MSTKYQLVRIAGPAGHWFGGLAAPYWRDSCSSLKKFLASSASAPRLSHQPSSGCARWPGSGSRWAGVVLRSRVFSVNEALRLENVVTPSLAPASASWHLTQCSSVCVTRTRSTPRPYTAMGTPRVLLHQCALRAHANLVRTCSTYSGLHLLKIQELESSRNSGRFMQTKRDIFMPRLLPGSFLSSALRCRKDRIVWLRSFKACVQE